MKSLSLFSKAFALKNPELLEDQNLVILFLSSDFKSFCEMKKKLKNSANISLLGERFHNLAQQLQPSFLELCHSITEKNNSDAYWMTPLASRSSTEFPLFRELLFCSGAKEILQETSNPIVIIFDNFHTGTAIKKYALSQNYQVNFKHYFFESLTSAKLFLKLLRRAFIFLLNSANNWTTIRRLNLPKIPSSQSRPIYILRSWFTKGVLNEHLEYKDRNFSHLPQFLSRNGAEVWVLPLFFNLQLSLKEQAILMKKASLQLPFKFLFLEQYLSPLAYFKILQKNLSTLFLDLNNLNFNGFQISQLTKSLHRQSLIAPEQLQYNLCTELFKKLSQTNCEVSKFIYTFENNSIEKPFILSAKKYFPQTEIIGFQHSVWYKEQPAMQILEREKKTHPLPDKIITSGVKYLEVLEKMGFPKDITFSGPNLRFTEVHNTKTKKHPKKKLDILIVLNFEINQCMEILETTALAIGNNSPLFSIGIKIHPLLSQKFLNSFLKEISFPKYKWVTGVVQELVQEAKVVLMTGGSVSNLETIILSAPLIRVSLGNQFDLDPLWSEYPLGEIAQNSDDLSSKIKQTLETSPTTLKALEEFALLTRNEYFTKPTERLNKQFL